MPCRRRWSAASTRSRALCRVRSRPACKAPSSRSRRRSTASSTRRSLRVIAKLNQLISKIDAKIEPAFTRLQSLANIHIGEDFATIDDVKVNVTAIGISDATAFVGMPPAGGINFSKLNRGPERDRVVHPEPEHGAGLLQARGRQAVAELHGTEAHGRQRGVHRRRRGHSRHRRARHHGRAQPRREARAGLPFAGNATIDFAGELPDGTNPSRARRDIRLRPVRRPSRSTWISRAS